MRPWRQSDFDGYEVFAGRCCRFPAFRSKGIGTNRIEGQGLTMANSYNLLGAMTIEAQVAKRTADAGTYRSSWDMAGRAGKSRCRVRSLAPVQGLGPHRLSE